MMIKIVVTPPMGTGIALGILDRYIRAIVWARKIAAPRGLDARTVVVLPRQRELQFFEHDCPFGEFVRLLVDLVGARLDVDVVIFRESGARLRWVRFFGASLATIKRNWSKRRSDVHPFAPVLRQEQIPGSGVLGQITRPRLRLRPAPGKRLCQHGYHNCAARGRRSYS